MKTYRSMVVEEEGSSLAEGSLGRMVVEVVVEEEFRRRHHIPRGHNHRIRDRIHHFFDQTVLLC